MTEDLLSPQKAEGDDRLDSTLRPRSLDEFVGQEKLKSNLRIFIEAANRRKEPLDHCFMECFSTMMTKDCSLEPTSLGS